MNDLPTCNTRWPVRSFVLAGCQTIEGVPDGTDNDIHVFERADIQFLPPLVYVRGKFVVASSIASVVKMATMTSGT